MRDLDVFRRRLLAALALAGAGALPACSRTVTSLASPADAALDAPADDSFSRDAASDHEPTLDALPDDGTAIDAPSDDGPAIDAVFDAPDGDVLVCGPYGRYRRMCLSTNHALWKARNPPHDPLPGVDAGLPRDVPVESLGPGGCPAPGLVEDSCCNPAETVAFVEGGCCYEWCQSGCCGRPLTVEGAPRTASCIAREDWGATREGHTHELDAITRAALADAWADDALLEHASIAAFARLTLELLAHGAPADLVRDAQRAGLDEVHHATDCFALATRFADAPRGPGALDLSGVSVQRSLVELAVDAAREGCLGETLSALFAARQAEGATDPETRALLARIADDEARHAELSWRVVAWACAVDARCRHAVASTLRDALAAPDALPRPRPRPPGVAPDVWTAFGRLTRREADAVVRDALRSVLVPCVAALFPVRDAPTNTTRSVTRPAPC